jgi:hypothetical protein
MRRTTLVQPRLIINHQELIINTPNMKTSREDTNILDKGVFLFSLLLLAARALNAIVKGKNKYVVYHTWEARGANCVVV